MASTFKQLKDRIASMANQNFSESDIGTAINSSIDYLRKWRFWFTEGEQSITLTSGQADQTAHMPSNFGGFLEPNGIVISDDGIYIPLSKIDSLSYDSIYEDNSRGLPRYFTYRNGELLVYPEPDQAYTGIIYFMKTYTALSADGDTNDFTDYADRLVQYKTLEDLYMDYRHDPERAAIYGNKFKDELTILKQENYEKTATGFLQNQEVLVDSGDYLYRYVYPLN